MHAQVRELERDVKEARDQAIADAQSKLRQRDVRYRQQLQEAVMELEVDAHTNIHASNARVHTPDGTGTADAGTDADADIDTAGQGSVLSAKQRAQQRSMMKAKRKQMLMSVSSRPAFYKPSTSFTYPQDVHM